MPDAIRAAVVGVGYLGAFHAEKYASLPGVELVGVVDADADRAAAIGAKVGAPAIGRIEDLFGRIDCASIAVPTPAHFAVASALLDAGHRRPRRKADHRHARGGARARRPGRRSTAASCRSATSSASIPPSVRSPACSPAALHRVPPPGALHRARHGRRRHPRPDDPRPRRHPQRRLDAARARRGGRRAGALRARRHRQRAAALRRRHASPTSPPAASR